MRALLLLRSLAVALTTLGDSSSARKLLGGVDLEDFKTFLAKAYGFRRTLTFNAWQGKCFAKEYDEIDGTETPYVINRIKLNYGPIVNSLLGLQEPVNLFQGDVVRDKSSYFDGKLTTQIDYSNFTHEFKCYMDDSRSVPWCVSWKGLSDAWLSTLRGRKVESAI